MTTTERAYTSPIWYRVDPPGAEQCPAIGPKQTWALALHMSAFGGKADMAIALGAEKSASDWEKSTASCAGFTLLDGRRGWLTVSTAESQLASCANITLHVADNTMPLRRKFRIFVKCLDSSLSGEKFHKLAVDVAKTNYIGDKELRLLAIKGLSALANRVPTKTEDDRIAEIRKPFGLGPGDLGEAGRKLTKVEILRDLEEGRVPLSDRKLFSLRNLTILSAILLAAIVGWIAWPYYSVYELAIALRDGDVSGLDNRVGWDSRLDVDCVMT